MRCTHYMKNEIIRISGEMMLNQYHEMINSHNQYFTDMNYNNIIKASIHILEQQLSIDSIEVDNVLMSKIRHKATKYYYDKAYEEFFAKRLPLYPK